MFRLKCLGGLALESASASAPVALQRRRLTLLALLARSGELGITRDRLMALLWPEADAASARHALDQLLYATRRELGKEAILSDGGQLRLNPTIISCDAVQFDTHFDTGNAAAAVALYAGPFMDGVHVPNAVELERWIDGERALLAERFLAALEQLANAARAEGDLQASLDWWKRRMAAEPFNERGALALMHAHADAGDPCGAVRYARAYRTLLEEELGTSPGSGIQHLVEVLRQETSPAVEAHAPRHAARGEHAEQAETEHGTLTQPSEVPAPTFPVLTWAAAAAGLALLMIAGLAVLESQPSTAAATADVRAHVPRAPAQALYMQGTMMWNLRSREGLEQAAVLYRKAASEDPLYAEAYAGLANTYVILGYLGYLPGDASFPKGKAAAQQALALDPYLGEAHTALAIALQWERNWQEAERELRRAMQYAPDNATAHQHYALLLTILGRRDEAVAHARRGAELDPLSVQINNTYAVMLRNAGRADSALAVYRRIVTDEPDTAWVRQNPWVLANFGGAVASAKRHDEGIRMIERAVAAVPRHPRPLSDLARVYLELGDTAKARKAFAQADPQHTHYPLYRALLHASLGDVDSAFVWLDRVQDWSPVMLLPIGIMPPSSPLGKDPRFAALRKKLNLAP